MRGVDACSQPRGSESDQDPLDLRIVTVINRDEIEDAMKVYDSESGSDGNRHSCAAN